MSLNDFSKIGEPSGRGNATDAMNMFKSRVENVNDIIRDVAYYKDGTIKGVYYTGYDKFGNKIVYRTYSSTHGSFHTLDLYNGFGGKVKKEIKFRE